MNFCSFLLHFQSFFDVFILSILSMYRKLTQSPHSRPKKQQPHRNEPKKPEKTQIFFKISPQSFGN